MHGMPRPVGRPPLNVKATVVRLGKGVPARIDRVLDKEKKEKRADLIRGAVEVELQRREAELKKKRPK
jgi:metal-responsive CopG/Arc/MetJ family transcriptional regulator